MTTKKVVTVILACTIGFGAFVAPTAAMAAETTATPVAVASPADGSNTDAGETLASATVTNQDCIDAIAAAVADGVSGLSADTCTTTVTLQATASVPVSMSDLAPAKSSLGGDEYTSLITSAAAGTLKRKTYSQQMNNITDSETQYGTFYYDGSHAWVTSTYRGYKGSHFCKVDWAGAYAVTSRGCSESGSTSQRNLTAHWNFALGVAGSPVSWDELYTLHVNSAGRIWQ